MALLLQAYDPDMREYKHTEPTEAALIERIELRQVKHAIQIYRKMKKLSEFIGWNKQTF